MSRINILSKIFQPLNVLPKNATIKNQDKTSNSQRLMLDLGIIRLASPGCFHLLPLGLRSMEKLSKIVDLEMQKIGAQKIVLPTLINADLWKTTGRIETGGQELFTLKDRHNKKYVLSPTHEEAVSDLLASVSPLSYRQFPLRLYQISSKYRDEIKPRFGLMRGRQFIMKDLYTFDTNIENARKTYSEICESYNSIFDKLGIKFVKVLGLTGNIGGSVSHEYHFIATIGEDRILNCAKCNYAANVELCGSEKCPKCDNKNVDITSGIEVGHTFLLLDKYSTPLNAKYSGLDGKTQVLQMGSYGLGLSRILAASVEVMSQENEIRWPVSLAPFCVVIIPPKEGSKEQNATANFGLKLYSSLETIPPLINNILIDDRSQMTIGKRLFEARRIGYPLIIVIGSSAIHNPPLFELHDLINNIKLNLSENAIYDYVKQKFSLFGKQDSTLTSSRTSFKIG